MIKPIYRLCSACAGTKVVEHIPHLDGSMVDYSKEARKDKCQACKGRGYIPTGDFIFEAFDKDDILTQIEELGDEDLIRTIKAKTW